jgi:hypothetical protein
MFYPRLDVRLPGMAANSPPWSLYDAPKDLPADLRGIYELAARAILTFENLCYLHERDSARLKDLSAWAFQVKRECAELARWMVGNEGQLRGNAPEVLSTIQAIRAILHPAVWEITNTITLLTGVPVDPDDGHLVSMARSLTHDPAVIAKATQLLQNDDKNQLNLGDATLEKLSVARDSLEPLRTHLSEWAKRRVRSLGIYCP